MFLWGKLHSRRNKTNIQTSTRKKSQVWQRFVLGELCVSDDQGSPLQCTDDTKRLIRKKKNKHVSMSFTDTLHNPLGLTRSATLGVTVKANFQKTDCIRIISVKHADVCLTLKFLLQCIYVT